MSFANDDIIRLDQELNELRDQLAESVEGEEREVLKKDTRKQTELNKVLIEEANDAKGMTLESQAKVKVSYELK